jgi:hypothetical protein
MDRWTLGKNFLRLRWLSDTISCNLSARAHGWFVNGSCGWSLRYSLTWKQTMLAWIFYYY